METTETMARADTLFTKNAPDAQLPAVRADAPIADPMAWTRRDRGEMLQVLKSSLYPGASDEMAMAVMAYCAAAGLNVMLKPVHIVPMYIPKKEVERDGRKVTVEGTGCMRDIIMPGIGHYRTQAARTGRYIGLSAPEWGPPVTYELSDKNGGTPMKVTVPEWCRITAKVLVDGRECEFVAEEFWIENYATAGRDTDKPNAMWAKRSRGQLAKVTEAQALRKAFPELIGGETAEEMEGKSLFASETVIDVPAKRSANATAALDSVTNKRPAGRGSKTQDRAQDQRGATPDDMEAAARVAAGKSEQPALPTEDTGEVPKMPEDALSEWRDQKKWSKGWRWLNEAMRTIGPKGRQELADEHADLLWAVHGFSDAYKKAAEEFAATMGVTVKEASGGDGAGA